MTIRTWRSFFLWSTILNYAILLIWFLAFVFLRDWMRDFHGQWFHFSEEQFDLMHYCGMGLFKVLVISFCFVPWLALTIASKRSDQ